MDLLVLQPVAGVGGTLSGPAQGSLPPARSSHGAAGDGSRLFVHGGMGGNGELCRLHSDCGPECSELRCPSGKASWKGSAGFTAVVLTLPSHAFYDLKVFGWLAAALT
jgi:hypothetical protein